MNDQPSYPRCCSAPVDYWPLPQTLAGVRLLSTRFDPALLDPEDFGRWEIPPQKGVSKRQTEFLAGRFCAREALLTLTGAPFVPPVGEDRAPQWPPSIVGSITHGAGWAGAVVGRRQQWDGLGLDIERLLTPERADRLAGEILTPRELECYAPLSDIERAELVTRTFSLKESLFKALYPLVKRRFYFQDAAVVSFSPQGTARLRLLIDLSENWRNGAELDGQFATFDGYLLSLINIPSKP
ncbi:4'-phosphopantetheinyl transferase superfamily protein [Pseudomonas stutzeri]|uniref:Enterobactin synthase component D n=1 Tax=Stutzerimonas stutzeri TaxID=316 RepID=A0A2N8S7F7_STUST|nr:4'-phosphopantetheinyl transferase superfamily protein [Stutzerimonas stutzeri]MCQ4294879.1 4'-phosphopantetheinyl transferase superfamily protein [Stutzerimonas stutzeri]PNF82559.1 4'-phosphopantetheinyl transferase [Stutzerimonas stutzeri]